MENHSIIYTQKKSVRILTKDVEGVYNNETICKTKNERKEKIGI